MSVLQAKQAFEVGQRVRHPMWLGKPAEGVVTRVPNQFHTDVRFDGWNRDIRAATASLEVVEP